MMSSTRVSLLAAAMAVGGVFAAPAHALTATAQPALLNHDQGVAKSVEEVGYRRNYRGYQRPYRHYGRPYYQRRYYGGYYRRPYYPSYGYGYGYGGGYGYGYPSYPYAYGAPVVGFGIGVPFGGWGWGGHRHWGGGHWGRRW